MTSATSTERPAARERSPLAGRPQDEPDDRARPPHRRLAVAAVAALMTIAALVALVDGLRSDHVDPASAETAAWLAGIPQDGAALGAPDAPVTLVEFVDLQCAPCAALHRDVLPAIVDRYVRSGRVRLELRTLAFLGEDSVRAAQAVAGAAGQDRGWAYAHRFFARQRAVNSGYITDRFVRATAAGVPGLDAAEVASARDTGGITLAERDAVRADIRSTPALLVGPTGGEPQPAELDRLDLRSLTHVIDGALAAA